MLTVDPETLESLGFGSLYEATADAAFNMKAVINHAQLAEYHRKAEAEDFLEKERLRKQKERASMSADKKAEMRRKNTEYQRAKRARAKK